jgi:hypothetical protein
MHQYIDLDVEEFEAISLFVLDYSPNCICYYNVVGET